MTDFAYGDMVCFRQCDSIKGMVISERNWGESYTVRLAGGLEVATFESVELDLIPPNNTEPDGVVLKFEKPQTKVGS